MLFVSASVFFDRTRIFRSRQEPLYPLRSGLFEMVCTGLLGVDTLVCSYAAKPQMTMLQHAVQDSDAAHQIWICCSPNIPDTVLDTAEKTRTVTRVVIQKSGFSIALQDACLGYALFQSEVWTPWFINLLGWFRFVQYHSGLRFVWSQGHTINHHCTPHITGSPRNRTQQVWAAMDS